MWVYTVWRIPSRTSGLNFGLSLIISTKISYDGSLIVVYVLYLCQTARFGKHCPFKSDDLFMMENVMIDHNIV